MEKMWSGRSSGQVNKLADDFNSSISFDQRLIEQDIIGSLAHAKMLLKVGIITKEDEEQITSGLKGILADYKSGKLEIDEHSEDVHMFVEAVLTQRIGECGKRLHTARSRNDQVALDLRLYLREQIDEIIIMLTALIKATADKAEENKQTVVPGYTHLQRAQPISFAHQLLAYTMMFRRDILRLKNTSSLMNISPLGSCALAGTTFPIDRALTSELLGFDGFCENSIDGVSDRDYAIELLSDLSIIMMHLSRFSEEIILWSSWEFSFIELSDSFTTGSSIMPQKKNSDMAELARGKTGRVYGDLITLLTVMKGLPLAYNKDMQEDKQAVFDGIDTIKSCLEVFAPMVSSMSVKGENMEQAAKKGFINATDLADYLVRKGLPFRSAYKCVGEIVGFCISQGLTLEQVPLSTYKELNNHFDEDLYEAIELKHCVNQRVSPGGPSPASVEKQLEMINEFINNINANMEK